MAIHYRVIERNAEGESGKTEFRISPQVGDIAWFDLEKKPGYYRIEAVIHHVDRSVEIYIKETKHPDDQLRHWLKRI